MNIKQLRLVIRLAEEQRDAATAQLASGKAQWQVAQDQLEQLQRYQGQYVVQAKQALTEQWMDAARYVQALEQLETLQVAKGQREQDRRDQQFADDQYAIRNFSPDYSTA